MTMRKFIRDNRAEIDSAIRRACPNVGSLNDEYRRQWIANDEGLYLWARAEMRQPTARQRPAGDHLKRCARPAYVLAALLLSSTLHAAPPLPPGLAAQPRQHTAIVEQISVKLVAPGTPALKGRPWTVTRLTAKSCTVWTARRADMAAAFGACADALAGAKE